MSDHSINPKSDPVKLNKYFLKELRTVEKKAQRGDLSAYLVPNKDYTIRLYSLRDMGYITIKHLIGWLADVALTDAGRSVLRAADAESSAPATKDGER